MYLMPRTPLLITTLTSLLLLSACGSDDKNSSISDTEGDIHFRATITTNWSGANFPTQYPGGAHWSSPIGTVHNEQVIFWRENDQPASDGIEVMAESGGTEALTSEINTAKSSGYSQGLVKMNSIGSGSGSSSIEFSTTDDFTLFTIVSMIAPSPDWFIGVDSFNLKEGGEWVDEIEIRLPLYDAGTDAGLSFTSADSDTGGEGLPITLVTTERSDSDFSSGIHYDSAEYVATLTIKRIQR